MNHKKTKPIFIVFEGLDGSGKTTCAKRTAELIEAQYLTTPSEVVRTYRDEIIASFGTCQEAAQLFYLATVFAAADEAKSFLDKGVSVVLDRYFLSTQVYAEFRGTRLELDDKLVSTLLPADMTVFLDTTLEIRRGRLVGRGRSSESDRETLTVSADIALRNGYAQRTRFPVVGKWLCIDVSICSPDGIARRVAHAL